MRRVDVAFLVEFLQTVRRGSSGFTYTLRHLGAFGLFFLAILDSSPFPTFGGLDIFTAVLAASHRNPWYEYAAVATSGSIIGAYLTFRLARRAGMAYLDSKFGTVRVAKLLRFYKKWGTGALAASAAIPFPFPTSLFFAAAGASDYRTSKFIIVVSLCRGMRYSLLAFLGDHYGRHFVRVIRHPTQYWGWLLLFALIIAGVIGIWALIVRQGDAAIEAGTDGGLAS